MELGMNVTRILSGAYRNGNKHGPMPKRNS